MPGVTKGSLLMRIPPSFFAFLTGLCVGGAAAILDTADWRLPVLVAPLVVLGFAGWWNARRP